VNFADTSAPECTLNNATFFGKVLVKLFTPIIAWVLGLIMFVLVALFKHKLPVIPSIRTSSGPLIMTTMTLGYTLALKAAIQPLDCELQPDGTYTLVLSPNIQCYSPEWMAYLPIMVVFWIIYFVIVPVVITHLYTKQKLRATNDYRLGYTWWSGMVLVRLAIMICLTTLVQGTIKYFLTLLFSLLFMVIEYAYNPFNDEVVAKVSVVWNALVALVLVGAVVFSSNSVTDAAMTGVAATLITLIVVCFVMTIMYKSPSCQRNDQKVVDKDVLDRYSSARDQSTHQQQ